mgnify:CR=1 FL=1
MYKENGPNILIFSKFQKNLILLIMILIISYLRRFLIGSSIRLCVFGSQNVLGKIGLTLKVRDV